LSDQERDERTFQRLRALLGAPLLAALLFGGACSNPCTPGAWLYHAESLRLLSAPALASIVASAPANYCD
jgi:hypothetical protein